MKFPTIRFIFVIFIISSVHSIENLNEHSNGSLQKMFCSLQKLMKSLKLKPKEKLKFLLNPFETFPTTDDVKEVVTTPKYLLANLLVVVIIFKVIAVFAVLVFLIYGSYFNSLF